MGRFRLIKRGLESLHTYGLWYTAGKTFNKIRNDTFGVSQRRELFAEVASKTELSQQRTASFPREIKISIVVPAYNTSKQMFSELLQSVLNQTYQNWELCVVDGSDDEHTAVAQLIKSICDSRVIYKKIQNQGIAQNTNIGLKMASGDYIGLLDHDDILHPSALYEVASVISEKGAELIYSDEAVFEDKLTTVTSVHYKPDFAPDNLRANNYICHFMVFSRSLQERTGLFRSEYNGSQDHDYVLRMTENTYKIEHISKLLYWWRSHPGSVAFDIGEKNYAAKAGVHAVQDHLRRVGMEASVESSDVFPAIYRINYALTAEPLVTIIIPNRDHVAVLKECIDSVLRKSTYKNIEIVIVENGSKEQETFSYYDKLSTETEIQIVTAEFHDETLNISKTANLGALLARGEQYLFLKSCMKVSNPSWIQEMLMYAQRSDVGAVGAQILDSDGRVRHAGIILGLGENHAAGRAFLNDDARDSGYMGRLWYAQDLSAVSGDCIMIPSKVFKSIGGFDESYLCTYEDVDFCLRLREAGYLVVYTPYAQLTTYKSPIRRKQKNKVINNLRKRDIMTFSQRWEETIQNGDPYYNKNFSLKGDFQY